MDESCESPLGFAGKQLPPRRFALRALLGVVTIVAAFLGGVAARRGLDDAPQAGAWLIRFPLGAQRQVTLLDLGNDRFQLLGSGNLGGEYLWNGSRLVVQKPDDARFIGLEWRRDDDDLVLVAEPPNHPAGAQYMGTRLRFLKRDPSAREF